VRCLCRVCANGASPAYGVCPVISSKALEKAVAAKYAEIPLPENFDGLVRMLDDVLGTSKDGPIHKIATGVNGGQLIGGACLASYAVEQFLFEYGAGLTLGWGELPLSQLYALLPLQAYKEEIDMPFAYAQNMQSNLLSHIAQSLNSIYHNTASDTPNTVFYVGHDT
jgi:hypothetical protein